MIDLNLEQGAFGRPFSLRLDIVARRVTISSGGRQRSAEDLSPISVEPDGCKEGCFCIKVRNATRLIRLGAAFSPVP